MKFYLLVPALTLALSAHAAPSTPDPVSTYLVCTGIEPLWHSGWFKSTAEMDGRSKRIIKLSQDATKATISTMALGEQVFDLTTDGESYIGSKKLNIAELDRRISKASISIDRITGLMSVAFTVTGEPLELVAFVGNCQRANVKF